MTAKAVGRPPKTERANDDNAAEKIPSLRRLSTRPATKLGRIEQGGNQASIWRFEAS